MLLRSLTAVARVKRCKAGRGPCRLSALLLIFQFSGDRTQINSDVPIPVDGSDRLDSTRLTATLISSPPQNGHRSTLRTLRKATLFLRRCPNLIFESTANADFSLGYRDHDPRTLHQAPASDFLCPGSSDEYAGPHSWCKIRFEFDRPPSGAFPIYPAQRK